MRLVDELSWLNAIRRPDPAACGPDGEQAPVLRRQVASGRGAGARRRPARRVRRAPRRSSTAALTELHEALVAMEQQRHGRAPRAREAAVEARRAGRRSSSPRSTRAFARRS